MPDKVPTGAMLVVILVLSLTVAFALPVGAQDSPVIRQAELRLWPEYDDPGLLVIVSGSFESDTSFPLKVAFPIPDGARNVQATYLDASGTLINQPFEMADGKLVYELPTADFHYEFYLDRAPSGDQRTISYVLDAPYAIQTLGVAVQQPARSTDFTLTPAAESSEQKTDGLIYHILNRQDVAAGEELKLVLNYSKPDTGLTAPQLAVTTADAPAQSGQSPQANQSITTADSTAWLPWLLIGSGVVLLAGSLTYWILSQRRNSGQPLSTSGPPPGAGPKAPPDVQSSAPRIAATGQAPAFCTSCGNRLREDDRFCSQCGTSRRS